jgi:predicted Zn-dependent protease
MRRVITPITIVLLIFYMSVLCYAEFNEDQKYGFFVDRMLLSTETIVLNEKLNQKINEIGNKVARSSENQLPFYTFRVLNNPTLNAMSAAGGYIYIYSGLLDILESEDELAGVLGHEIGHTNNNHQKKLQVAEYRTTVAGIYALKVLFNALDFGAMAGGYALGSSGMSPIAQNLAGLGISVATGTSKNIVAQTGVALMVSAIQGYSQNQELEADELAVKSAFKAGYDPKAYLNVNKRLLKIRDSLGPRKEKYMSSLINAKPGLEERIKNLERLLAQTGKAAD